MEENIWKMLYERAKAVQCERKLSLLMEVGSVGAAILTDQGTFIPESVSIPPAEWGCVPNGTPSPTC